MVAFVTKMVTRSARRTRDFAPGACLAVGPAGSFCTRRSRISRCTSRRSRCTSSCSRSRDSGRSVLLPEGAAPHRPSAGSADRKTGTTGGSHEVPGCYARDMTEAALPDGPRLTSCTHDGTRRIGRSCPWGTFPEMSSNAWVGESKNTPPDISGKVETACSSQISVGRDFAGAPSADVTPRTRGRRFARPPPSLAPPLDLRRLPRPVGLRVEAPEPPLATAARADDPTPALELHATLLTRRRWHIGSLLVVPLQDSSRVTGLARTLVTIRLAPVETELVPGEHPLTQRADASTRIQTRHDHSARIVNLQPDPLKFSHAGRDFWLRGRETDAAQKTPAFLPYCALSRGRLLRVHLMPPWTGSRWADRGRLTRRGVIAIDQTRTNPATPNRVVAGY
jgi:hypothetical protein